MLRIRLTVQDRKTMIKTHPIRVGFLLFCFDFSVRKIMLTAEDLFGF